VFDLAKAMTENYKLVVRKNPAFMTDMFLKVLDEDDNIIADIPVSVMSKGTFTIATRDEENNVYLLVDEDEPCGEMTKAFLADLNNRDGEQPFIPVVEAIGWYKKPRTQNKYLRVYKSPLYKSPFKKADSPQGWEMYKVLKRVIEDSSSATYDRRMAKWSLDMRYRVASDMQSLDEEPPKSVDELTWKSFCETVAYMCNESVNYSDVWLMEISPRNLATDGNGQLILLDIFFNAKANQQHKRGKC
jgi:hypothetical protein